jgi:hypothetical protein
MEKDSKWNGFDGTCDTCPIAHDDSNLDCELYHKLFPNKCNSQANK